MKKKSKVKKLKLKISEKNKKDKIKIKIIEKYRNEQYAIFFPFLLQGELHCCQNLLIS